MFGMSERQPARDRGGDASIPHGTPYCYDKLGCRCESCAVAMRERRASLKKKRLARKAAGEDHPHGLSGYTMWHCRCSECVAAKRAYDQEYRAAHGEEISDYGRRWRDAHPGRSEYLSGWRGAKEQDEIPHGTSNGYDNYGCRCSDCKDAHATRVSRSVAKVNSETLGEATKHRQQWTGPELELLVTRTDLTLRELAKSLGRSRHAVASARRRALKEPKYINVAGVSESQTYPAPPDADR